MAIQRSPCWLVITCLSNVMALRDLQLNQNLIALKPLMNFDYHNSLKHNFSYDKVQLIHPSIGDDPNCLIVNVRKQAYGPLSPS